MRSGGSLLVWSAVRGHRHGHDGWARGTCPFCAMNTGKADHRRSLSVRVETGYYSCWRCGESGWADLEDGGSSPPVNREAREVEQADLGPPEGFTPLWTDVGQEALSLAPARAFLEKRGVTLETIRRARIGACAVGRLAGRVVVPVFSRWLDVEAAEPHGDWTWRSTWVGWVARAWVKKADKPYLYPRGMHRGHQLFNHAALLRCGPTGPQFSRPVVVVEGAFDALYVGPDGAACLGSVSDEQYDALLACPRTVAVVLDGDAWRQGHSMAVRLRLDGKLSGSVRLPAKVDPDEVPRRELLQAALECVGMTEPLRL